MFDLAWSEIALIGVVALIAIGPKDMPVAIKAVAEMIKKARRMASEFQTHVDEMVREANLHEVRDHINDIRSMDIKGKILGAVDGDGSIRRTIHEQPYTAPPPVTPVAADDGATVPPAPEPTPSDPASVDGATLAAPPPALPAYIDPRGTPPALPAQPEPATHSTPHA